MARPKSAGELDAVALETSLLEEWKTENAFQQSIETNRNGAPFIFLEGPPTANGKPGIHHVVARAYKDLVCRWKTMEGFRVERKGGWDTHGLPVEIEVELLKVTSELVPVAIPKSILFEFLPSFNIAHPSP